MKRWGFVFSAVLLPVAIVALLMAFGNAATARLENAVSFKVETVTQPGAKVWGASTVNSASRLAYVFRFDPVLENFETFTIPTGAADPHSVAVVSNATSLDVWFTEPGADKIGLLVYTATSDYVFHEYTVTFGSWPLNLVVDESRGLVWFTEQAGNRIGQLQVDGGGVVTYTTFDIDTPNSRPTGIDLAPDGSVWFTEMGADKIGHLVVTTTNDYEVDEYPIAGTDVGVYGLEVQSNQYVWFGARNTGMIMRLKVADGSMDRWFSLGDDSYPFDLLYDSGRDFLWVTEPGSDRVSQVELTTFIIVNPLDLPDKSSSPMGLTQFDSNQFWFAEHTSGLISRLVYTSPTSFYFTSFTLPVRGAYALDISAGDDGALWTVGYDPHRIHLPLVARNYYNAPQPPFGVQMYGTINYTTGLSEVVAVGASWIRMPISWRNVEFTNVTPDQYYWGYTDAQVTALTEAGIEPLLTLAGNPEWAAAYAMGPVTDVANLQEFMGALVERYDGDGVDDAPGSPVVTYWEIYNEPDGTDILHAQHGGYGFFGYHGDVYAAHLDAIYPVVKAVNPKAQVVFGGVAADNFDFEGGVFDPNFVDEVLANCTSSCFDVMNFHYFPVYRFRWESFGKDVIGKTEFFRSKMSSHGFDRPVMCTETSWAAAGIWGSTALQTRYPIAVYVRTMAADLVMSNWYAWKDTDSGLPGLLDDQLQPKPVYYAYQTLTQQLGQAVFERVLAVAETGHADIEGYVFSVRESGEWERRDVVWLDCASLRLAPPQDCPGESQTMTIATNAVRIIDQFGVTRGVQDSDDGAVDGLVRLAITSDPIFIDYIP